MRIGKKNTPPPTPPIVEIKEVTHKKQMVISSNIVGGKRSLCTQELEMHS